MKLARITIPLTLLAEALQFPQGLRIRRVISADPRIHEQQSVELVLEGEALPVHEIIAGELIPEVMATAHFTSGELVPGYRLTFELVNLREPGS